MIQNLSEMTNTELKQYISEHRNNPDSFAAAMAIVMSRRNPANRQPYLNLGKYLPCESCL